MAEFVHAILVVFLIIGGFIFKYCIIKTHWSNGMLISSIRVWAVLRGKNVCIRVCVIVLMAGCMRA